jgi:3-isopropylmalate/(R)-2-methylmalate dehydratase small subunit
MKSFSQHRGLVVPINRIHIDTDQIIPKQFLKRIERSGYGQFLFHDWRYREDGSLRPEFELNQERYCGGTILLAGADFGCGSSREHAVWALMDYGFQAVLASSFSDIFYNNCFKNGLLPVRLEEKRVQELFRRCSLNPGYRMLIDLESRTICDYFGLEIHFDIDPFRRQCLLNGWDEIGLTLRYESKIGEYEKKHI